MNSRLVHEYLANQAGVAANGTPLPIPADLEARLAGMWFDPQKPPPDEPILVSIAGISCATAANLTTVTAPKKSGKSALLSAIAAASISPDADTLGVRAFNAERKVVLHFDTEQSPKDHWNLCDSILRRARLTESPLFKSLCLTPFSLSDRLAAVKLVVRRQTQGSGLFLVIIDGHGDLVRNVNDPEETADYVADLQTLAIETRCHIYGALHLNPGSDFKSRGHLGSELERKSQTNLRVDKKDGIFSIWGEDNRGAPIPKSLGPRFHWSDAERMHVSVASRAQAKRDSKVADATMKVREAFRLANTSTLAYTPLLHSLLTVPCVKSESTAYRLFDLARKVGFISEDLLGVWRLAP